MTDPGAAELDDDVVALGIVADAAHELDGGAVPPEGKGHLGGEAGRHEGPIRPATLDRGRPRTTIIGERGTRCSRP